MLYFCLMNSLFKNFLILFSLFFLNSCTTPSKTVSPLAASNQSWSSRATIQDLLQKKTHTVNIDIFMSNSEKLRMEISGMLNFSIASLVVDSTNAAYCIYPRKNCFFSKLSDQSLRPLFSLTLHPKDFFEIIHGRPMTSKNWTCSTEKNKLLCEETVKKITITTTFQKSGEKTIDVLSPQFSMNWTFDIPQTEVQLDDKVFTLQVPKNYTKTFL